MKSDDKWLMFKNYIHNELGISKADIQDWLKDAVQQVAQNMVAEAFGKFDPQKTVEDLVKSKEYWGSEALQKEIKAMIAEKIFSQLSITRK